MKSKIMMVAGLMMFGTLTLGITKVLAQSTLPRVTTACETRIGGVLMGIDDGFSTLKSCPGNSRRVILGEAGGTGGGSIPGGGNIKFMLGQGYVITDQGLTYHLAGNGEWEVIPVALPQGVTVDDIAQADNWGILTKTGELYTTTFSTSENVEYIHMGHP